MSNLLSRNEFLPGTQWPAELHARLGSFDEWTAFYTQHRYSNDDAYVEALAQEIARQGFQCPIHQHLAEPADIVFGAPNYREGLLYGQLNSRLRAVWMELMRVVGQLPPSEVRLYAPEAVTTFALRLRGHFARFIGSEFAPDPETRAKLFPVLHENLLDLSFPNEVFDAVVVNDVFEHVPNIDLCLGELARVTKPGGHLISTFPFNIGGRASVIKARLRDDGTVEHLMEPEYHGNPVDPGGSLVFEIPGWDILDRARARGWAFAEIVYASSVRHGIVGGGFSGIFTLVAQR